MSKPIQFEKSLQELENIVNQLEKGDLTLEESLKQFENGVNLVRQCQQALHQAEQKITKLTSTPPDADAE